MADDKYIITLQKKYIKLLEEQLEIANKELDFYKQMELDREYDESIENLFDR